MAALEPFVHWEFLNREDRRWLLAQLCPEITVYRYLIKGVKLNLPTGHKDSHPKTVR
jgi:hypothetical protein